MKSTLLLLQYLLYLNPEIGFHVTTTQHCMAFNSSSNLKTCNRALHTQVPTDSEIRHIKSFFGETPFTWFAEPADIATIEALEKNNMRYKATFPAMVLDLDNWNSKSIDTPLEIKQINFNEHEVAQWVDIVSCVFHVSDSELSKTVNNFMKQIDMRNLKLYIGFYQTKAVTAGMAIIHHDTASLHWIATLPEFRNQGLGYALTHKALLDAKDTNCKQAVLLASDLGKPIYERLGFRQYATYNIYGNY